MADKHTVDVVVVGGGVAGLAAAVFWLILSDAIQPRFALCF